MIFTNLLNTIFLATAVGTTNLQKNNFNLDKPNRTIAETRLTGNIQLTGTTNEEYIEQRWEPYNYFNTRVARHKMTKTAVTYTGNSDYLYITGNNYFEYCLSEDVDTGANKHGYIAYNTSNNQFIEQSTQPYKTMYSRNRLGVEHPLYMPWTSKTMLLVLTITPTGVYRNTEITLNLYNHTGQQATYSKVEILKTTTKYDALLNPTEEKTIKDAWQETKNNYNNTYEYYTTRNSVVNQGVTTIETTYGINARKTNYLYAIVQEYQEITEYPTVEEDIENQQGDVIYEEGKNYYNKETGYGNNYTISGTFATTYDVMPTTEVVDMGGLVFDILGMPFTFISVAFNLTLFPDTPYAINVSMLFLSLFAVVVFVFIVKLILGAIGHK